MNTPNNMPELTMQASNDEVRVRWWRYLYRFPALLWHVVIHLPLTVAWISLPGATRVRADGSTKAERAIRWWSGGLLRVFGMRSKLVGEPHRGAALIVANHISWLDIELIHSQRAVHFVAKSEIAGWPLVGWVAKRGGTIYHRRGSTESLKTVSQEMVQRLGLGHPVGVFPEGGTGDGSAVRTFHARIFQTALDGNVQIQPVALRYRIHGQYSPFVAFADGEGFLPNFLRLLGGPVIEAETHFLPPINDTGEGRRRLAERCRQAIAEVLERP